MFKSLLDFIFPPLCLACKERCSTQFLCPDCWILCEPPDPVGRCRHCFAELDEQGTLCPRCRPHSKQGPILKAVSAFVFGPQAPVRFLGLDPIDALAGFALHQWVQLEWPTPDGIIPMPDASSLALAKQLAHLLELPLIRALYPNGEYKEDRLEENGLWLLIDVSNSLEQLKTATFSLEEAFPKRIYLLSLFSYALDYT